MFCLFCYLLIWRKRLFIRGKRFSLFGEPFSFLLQNYKENRVFDGNKVQKTAKIVSREYN
jgi:hypothetical protein